MSDASKVEHAKDDVNDEDDDDDEEDFAEGKQCDSLATWVNITFL